MLGNALGLASAATLTRKLSRDGGNAHELIRASMAKASEIAAQFPRLRARLGTPAADYAAAPDNSFEFGIQVILDGLEAQLTARRPPAGQNAQATRHGLEPLDGPQMALRKGARGELPAGSLRPAARSPVAAVAPIRGAARSGIAV